jgi:hypothetical protein
MPVHDWTRVPAGIFHDFHNVWVSELRQALNKGILPQGFYALVEQQAGLGIADILTLQRESPEPVSNYRLLRKTLAIRHVSKHRLVALVEIVSPAKKDRAKSVVDFVKKAHAALTNGCNLLLVDLFPPGKFDLHGMRGAIWEDIDDGDDFAIDDKPLTLASYVAAPLVDAYVEQIAVGDSLPEMALFLDPDSYVGTPLEATYMQAYEGVPDFWQEVVEGKREAAE